MPKSVLHAVPDWAEALPRIANLDIFLLSASNRQEVRPAVARRTTIPGGEWHIVRSATGARAIEPCFQPVPYALPVPAFELDGLTGQRMLNVGPHPEDLLRGALIASHQRVLAGPCYFSRLLFGVERPLPTG